MAEPPWPQRQPVASPLASMAEAGTYGLVGADGPGITITERRALAIVQIAAFRGRAEAVAAALVDGLGVGLPSAPNTASTTAPGGEHAVTALWIGPEQWLVVAEGSAEGVLDRRLRDLLGGSAAVVDQSHGRCVLRVRGPKARDVLAKGCRLDLHPRAFAPGACGHTAVGALAVLIHAVDATPTFDLYVARGYAVAFWEWLTEAAGPVGYRVVA